MKELSNFANSFINDKINDYEELFDDEDEEDN